MNTSHALELEIALLSPPLPRSERAAECRDSASFERLVASERAYVTSLVGRLVGWRSDVEDLVQDVFVAALGGWAKFRGDCSPRTWLARIALNKCRSHGRRRWLRQRLFAAWQADPRPEPVINGLPGQMESAEQVHRALNRLSVRDREVIVLYYLQELTASEIAAAMKLNRNTVDVRLTRAKRRLKLLLAGEIE